ncbi:DUF2147 domain-containing protein [Sphingomonas turrisvirgatae]|uniref:DUF2147 domain-containing protein n=1 Tax=Sphingomonas turrisvirgatae TaxID=1888892 RepID=UPI00130170CB|nr:DUF2147 domain-containing protein [Sphingomonas turrisvirgatae]
MKSIRTFGLIAMAALLAGAAPPQQGIEGVYQNAHRTIRLRLAPCGDALCATVVWATDKARADARKGSGRELIGSQLLTDLRPTGPGKWRGKAYVPDLDRRATATVVRTRVDELRVSGCVLGGLICQSRHWGRID